MAQKQTIMFTVYKCVAPGVTPKFSAECSESRPGGDSSSSSSSRSKVRRSLERGHEEEKEEKEAVQTRQRARVLERYGWQMKAHQGNKRHTKKSVRQKRKAWANLRVLVV